MCCHTLLDHIVYMDVQMQTKRFVNTSQVIHNAHYRIYPVNILIPGVRILHEKFILMQCQ